MFLLSSDFCTFLKSIFVLIIFKLRFYGCCNLCLNFDNKIIYEYEHIIINPIIILYHNNNIIMTFMNIYFMSIRITRMKTSKAFCSITDRQTDKIITEQMLIHEGNLHAHKKMEQYLNQGPRKSRLTLNVVDGQTDGHLLLQCSFATRIEYLLSQFNSILAIFSI